QFGPHFNLTSYPPGKLRVSKAAWHGHGPVAAVGLLVGINGIQNMYIWKYGRFCITGTNFTKGEEIVLWDKFGKNKTSGYPIGFHFVFVRIGRGTPIPARGSIQVGKTTVAQGCRCKYGPVLGFLSKIVHNRPIDRSVERVIT